MKKLALKLDELVVESFRTQETEGTRGTVRGNDSVASIDYGCNTELGWICTAAVSCDSGCDTYNHGTCPSGNTCQDSCRGSCGTCVSCQEPTCWAETCPAELCNGPSYPC
jgi:hypothetical protein